MKKLLLGLLIAAPAFSVDILTPVIGLPDCAITGISGATPAVVTVASTSACGIVNDALLMIRNARNGTGNSAVSAVNVHLENSADTNGFCRVAKSVTSTTFQVYACDGTTAVTNNGTWTHGGRVAKGQWRTLNARPRGAFTPTLEACLQSSSAGGCYEAGRTERVALDALLGTAPDLTKKHIDFDGTYGTHALLKWYADGKPGSGTYYDRVRNSLINSGRVYPTTACNTGVIDCGYGGSGYADYATNLRTLTWQFLWQGGLDLLSAGERAALSDYIIADLDWTKGGENYTGTSLVFPPLVTGTGTISWTLGSAAVTGSGTSFTTEAPAGTWILLNSDQVYPRWYQVSSVTDNTHLTLHRVTSGDEATRSGAPFKLGADYVAGTHVGWVAIARIFYYDTTCAPGYPTTTGCPDYGNYGSGGFEPYHNHSIARLGGHLAMALAFAEEDPRWRRRLSYLLFEFYHRFMPAAWLHTGGLNEAMSGYYQGRIGPWLVAIPGSIKNSFTDAPDYLSGLGGSTTEWYDDHRIGGLMLYQPGRDIDTFSYGSIEDIFFQASSQLISWSNLFDKGGLAAAAKQYLTDAVGSQIYNSSVLQSVGGSYLPAAYMGNSGITASRGNPSFVAKVPLSAGCNAVFGSTDCINDVRFMLGTRSGLSASGAWGNAACALFYDFASSGQWDHGGQGYTVGPQISCNGKVMLGGDYATGGMRGGCGLGSIGCSNFVVGTESNFRSGYVHNPFDTTNGIAFLSKTWAHASATTTAASAAVTNMYKASVGLTSASRSVMHLRQANTFGYIFQRDDWAASGSVTVKSKTDYFIGESCGTPSSSSCISLSRAGATLSHTQTGARINTKWYGGTVKTENNSDTNGSCTGCTNNGFMVWNEGTGTSGSLYTVHQIHTNTATTMPTIVAGTQGSHFVIEVQDASAPVVAALAANSTVNLTSASFTTSHSGTALVAVVGLSPGLYDLKRNGAVVCGNVSVPSGDSVAECLMSSGTITAVAGGAPVTITTASPLPTGDQGVSYSTALAASGGVEPYTWSVLSGTLPAGLSLSSGGVISGTPSGSGLSSFTIRVTDSASGTNDKPFDLTINSAAPSGVNRTRPRNAVVRSIVIR